MSGNRHARMECASHLYFLLSTSKSIFWLYLFGMFRIISVVRALCLSPHASSRLNSNFTSHAKHSLSQQHTSPVQLCYYFPQCTSFPSYFIQERRVCGRKRGGKIPVKDHNFYPQNCETFCGVSSCGTLSHWIADQVMYFHQIWHPSSRCIRAASSAGLHTASKHLQQPNPQQHEYTTAQNEHASLILLGVWGYLHSPCSPVDPTCPAQQSVHCTLKWVLVHWPFAWGRCLLWSRSDGGGGGGVGEVASHHTLASHNRARSLWRPRPWSGVATCSTEASTRPAPALRRARTPSAVHTPSSPVPSAHSPLLPRTGCRRTPRTCTLARVGWFPTQSGCPRAWRTPPWALRWRCRVQRRRWRGCLGSPCPRLPLEASWSMRCKGSGRLDPALAAPLGAPWRLPRRGARRRRRWRRQRRLPGGQGHSHGWLRTWLQPPGWRCRQRWHPHSPRTRCAWNAQSGTRAGGSSYSTHSRQTSRSLPSKAHPSTALAPSQGTRHTQSRTRCHPVTRRSWGCEPQQQQRQLGWDRGPSDTHLELHSWGAERRSARQGLCRGRNRAACGHGRESDLARLGSVCGTPSRRGWRGRCRRPPCSHCCRRRRTGARAAAALRRLLLRASADLESPWRSEKRGKGVRAGCRASWQSDTNGRTDGLTDWLEGGGGRRTPGLLLGGMNWVGGRNGWVGGWVGSGWVGQGRAGG